MSSKSITTYPLHSMFLCRVLPFFTSSRLQYSALIILRTLLSWGRHWHYSTQTSRDLVIGATLIRGLLIDFDLIKYYLHDYSNLIMYLIQTLSCLVQKNNSPCTKYCENCGFILVGRGMTNKHCAKRGRMQAIKLKGEPSSEPNAKRQVAFLSIFTVKNVILSELLCLYISYR